MQKENQRVVITKRLLKEGVMKLLNKKHINDISISELCELSEINRTTFYRHYQTPNDVLLEIELDFVKKFYDPSLLKCDNDMKKYAVHMCSVLFEHKDLVKLFIRNNTDSDFSLIFQNFADEFFVPRKVLYKGQQISEDTLRLMTTFFSCGGYALLRQWIIEDIPLTPEEVAELIVGALDRNFTFE